MCRDGAAVEPLHGSIGSASRPDGRRIVDHNVDATKGLDCESHGLVHRLVVANVAHDREALASGLVDTLRRRVDLHAPPMDQRLDRAASRWLAGWLAGWMGGWIRTVPGSLGCGSVVLAAMATRAPSRAQLPLAHQSATVRSCRRPTNDVPKSNGLTDTTRSSRDEDTLSFERCEAGHGDEGSSSSSNEQANKQQSRQQRSAMDTMLLDGWIIVGSQID